jgi:hypothetical protein
MSLGDKMMKLGTSRNQCGACREYFNSKAPFVKHRVGDFGIDRRCLNVEEMKAKKMEKNSAGFWTNGLMDQSIIEKRNAIREQEKTVRQGI